jgi:hypothetical protein
MIQVCTKCGIQKDISEYYVRSNGKSHRSCKECMITKQKLIYPIKRDGILKYQENYRNEHKEQINNYQENYRAKNKDKARIYQNNRTKIDPCFRLARILRGRTRMAIKNGQKAGSAVKDLGCSVEELKTYLENRFMPGMSWDNWGLFGWHIDHIIPLSSFDLTDRTQFLKACHYTNLQPLWATDNMKKGDNI